MEGPLAAPADLQNWLEMPTHERVEMMAGPTITIYIGNIAILNIAKRAAMTLSKTLNAHFIEFPEHTEYHFEAGSLDPQAVSTLLVTWPRESCGDIKPSQVQFRKHFHENIAILRASRFLGMEKYTVDLLQHYTNYMRTQMPQLSEIAIVEDIKTSNKDPVWTTMVNHLCYLRYREKIPDPTGFAHFLVDHPELSDTMASVDRYFKERAAKQRQAKSNFHGSSTGKEHEELQEDAISYKSKFLYKVWDPEMGDRTLTEKKWRQWRASRR